MSQPVPAVDARWPARGKLERGTSAAGLLGLGVSLGLALVASAWLTSQAVPAVSIEAVVTVRYALGG